MQVTPNIAKFGLRMNDGVIWPSYVCIVILKCIFNPLRNKLRKCCYFIEDFSMRYFCRDSRTAEIDVHTKSFLKLSHNKMKFVFWKKGGELMSIIA